MSANRRTDKAYAALFGRFTGTSEASPPANEVLVGREGQRAYLVDLLIGMGRRGSYLITGRRGAGKTCFVQQCIAEYEASVFKRFLRAAVGRGIWDRVAVVLVWLLLILGALMLSEIALLLMQMTEKRVVLLWLLLVPAGVLLLYPAVYAKELFEACLETARPPFEKGARTRESRFPSVVGFYLVLIGAFTLWHTAPFGAPSLGISRVFAAVCSLYLFVQATSFYRLTEHGEERHRAAKTKKQSWATGNPLLWLYLPVAAYLLLRWPVLGETQTSESEYISNFGLGAFLLGLGLLFRTLHLWRRFRRGEKDPLRQASRRGAQYYRTIAATTMLVGLALWYSSLWPRLPSEKLSLPLMIEFLIPLVLALGALMAYLILRPRSFGETKSVVFRAQPKYVLAAKGILSIILALQLTQPILSTGYDWVVDSTMRWVYGEESQTREGAGPYSVGADSHSRSSNDHGEDRLRSSISLRCLSCVADSEGPPPRLFRNGRERIAWSLGLLLCLVLIHFLEYEWVIRPGIGSREDRALDPAARALPESQEVRDRLEHLRANRRIAELTFPWMVYRSWLPVLVTSVNLGFDKLDHRRVVQAMLVGLREQYHQAFLAWSCPLAILGRYVALMLVLVLVTLADESWFKIRDIPRDDYRRSTTETVAETPNDEKMPAVASDPLCDSLSRAPGGLAGFPGLACSVMGDRLLHILYFNLVPHSFGRAEDGDQRYANLLLSATLPFRKFAVPMPAGSGDGYPANGDLLPPGLYFCFYHVVLLMAFVFAGRWLLAAVPVLPYRQNLQRIDDVLDSLSAHTRITTRSNLWKPAQWVYGFFTDEQERQTERAPVDPRTVELAFLRILEDIQRGGVRMPGVARDHLSLPIPEITFVFDELDKLGTRADPEASTQSPLTEELEILNAERQRSMALLALLSDLKNLLSSADARFIFVGGRNLYDEWLADQTARQPLLTNIFSAQIYLPSLMTDYNFHQARKEGRRRLDQRTAEYLAYQYQRAELLYERWARKRWRPSYGLSIKRRVPESFVQIPLSDCRYRSPIPPQKLLVIETGEPVPREEANDLIRDFIRFLTYRSMGNPKRLKELLASFVRPVGRVFAPDVTRDHFFPCRHVLQFGDAEIFRVQLLESVYRHLTLAFEERLTSRDDKLGVSVFFLTDFLFKFHRRAFSWSNLERVDELIHIHRAPDLRDMLAEIVNHCSERFLHRVLNGLYAFRFRSDLAHEVEYLSRHSAEEMAAFNFTLDESQSLKAFYSAALRGMKEENPGLVSGLGELYEFDQEFDTARQYYKRAVNLLDADLEKRLTGGTGDGVRQILAGEPAGQGHARVFLKWGVVRLRLMMQIAMTFEHVRNLERAHGQYRTARSLSRTLFRAYIDKEGRMEDIFRLSAGESPSEERDSRLHVLKNLNILFQPVFAEAWVSEKMIGGIDTSVSLVERELSELRHISPFVRDPTTRLSTDPANVAGSNFSLIASQLHNKAGDLLFYKGRQRIPPEKLKDALCEEERPDKEWGWEGYLLRAHYHYAVCLHELRRYLFHRIKSSTHKFNIAAKRWPTFVEREWPDFIYRASASGMNDMAEATLARVSLLTLFRRVSQKPIFKRTPRMPLRRKIVDQEDFLALCSEWLEMDTREADSNIEILLEIGGGRVLRLGTLSSWFGAWEGPAAKVSMRDKDLITFGRPHMPEERLIMSINLCLAGARYFERGGYPEDAARELLKVVETVTHYLWWARMVDAIPRMLSAGAAEIPAAACDLIDSWLGSTGGRDPKNFDVFADIQAPVFWTYLVDLAVDTLDQAARLFRQSWRDEKASEDMPASKPYILGDTMPVDALTVACSLGLAAGDELLAKALERNDGTTKETPWLHLRRLIDDWTGELLPYQKDFSDEWPFSGQELTDALRQTLRNSLDRHRYPMINRLKGLKVLIDDLVLRSPGVDNDVKHMSAAVQWTVELLDMKSQFAAPLHFTPSHSGITFALVCLRWGRKGAELSIDQRREHRKLFRAAQRDLRASEEMYTQRRAYYEAISNLFYLYDDFNDRQIHFNHAIQMAGSELSTVLSKLLRLFEGSALDGSG